MTRAQKIGGAILFERATSLGSKWIDAIMILMLLWYGPLYGLILSFALGFLLELVWDLWILSIHLITSARGNDWTGVAEYKEWIIKPIPPKNDGPLNKAMRGVGRWFKWLLQHSFSHWAPMVFFWSVVWLESDYVTLLMKKDNKTIWPSLILKVTVPAAAWSIAVWAGVYWSVVLGAAWALEFAGPLPTLDSWSGIVEFLFSD